MPQAAFDLPVFFDLGATFALALSGALAAIRRNYDIVGVLALGLVSGIGGGLIRDGLFLNLRATALLTNQNYIFVILGATAAGVFFSSRVHHFERLIAVIDALGLGAYAAFGVQKSLQAGLSAPAAIMIGVVNAVGGGILRDLICREEPLVFKPGQFYLLTALAGATAFVLFSTMIELSANYSALFAVALTFVFRMLTIIFNWRTTALVTGNIFSGDGPDTPQK